MQLSLRWSIAPKWGCGPWGAIVWDASLLSLHSCAVSRGKVVLGYTEVELCRRGSGYQFVHAADMMHCAEHHVRSECWGAAWGVFVGSLKALAWLYYCSLVLSAPELEQL